MEEVSEFNEFHLISNKNAQGRWASLSWEKQWHQDTLGKTKQKQFNGPRNVLYENTGSYQLYLQVTFMRDWEVTFSCTINADIIDDNVLLFMATTFYDVNISF